jgi:hypothetical protein
MQASIATGATQIGDSRHLRWMKRVTRSGCGGSKRC